MTTCRQLSERIAKRFGAIAPGDYLTVSETETLLEAIQDEMRRLHIGRGPLVEVDARADYTAGANERVRVQDGFSVTVTLPNSVDISATASRQYDYGFAPSYDTPAGYTGSADGLRYRAPRDGDRIEIVGTTQGLYFYRSDINTWVNCAALTIDGPSPLNSSYTADFAAVVAVKVCRDWTGKEPTPQLIREASLANLRLYGPPGVVRDTVQATYF